MIKVKKVVDKKDTNKEIKVMELFGHEIIRVKDRKKYDVIYAKIDDEKPGYYSTYDLYKRVSKRSILPLWPLLTCAGISFVLVTIVLIMYIVDKTNPNMFIYLMAMGIPAAVFLFISVLYSSFKFKADAHNLQNEENIEDIRKELDRINVQKRKETASHSEEI